MTTIKAIKHTDVKGKELMYLKIEKEGKEPVLINVGEKTYNSVLELENEKEVKQKNKP